MTASFSLSVLSCKMGMKTASTSQACCEDPTRLWGKGLGPGTPWALSEGWTWMVISGLPASASAAPPPGILPSPGRNVSSLGSSPRPPDAWPACGELVLLGEGEDWSLPAGGTELARGSGHPHRCHPSCFLGINARADTPSKPLALPVSTSSPLSSHI